MNIDEYHQMIESLSEAGYKFRTLREGEDDSTGKHYVILRHDIDFSTELAREMAEWESRNGICATYFAQTRSPLYNPVSSASGADLAAIAALGHELGLHFDPSLYPSPSPADVAREVGILQLAVPECLTSLISLHRPQGALEDIRRVTAVLGIRTTYDEPWTTDYAYFSDSRGRWRHGSPLNSTAFSERRNLQILVHPLWWLICGDSPTLQLRELAHRSPDIVLRQLRETAVSFELR